MSNIYCYIQEINVELELYSYTVFEDNHLIIEVKQIDINMEKILSPGQESLPEKYFSLVIVGNVFFDCYGHQLNNFTKDTSPMLKYYINFGSKQSAS